MLSFPVFTIIHLFYAASCPSARAERGRINTTQTTYRSTLTRVRLLPQEASDELQLRPNHYKERKGGGCLGQ